MLRLSRVPILWRWKRWVWTSWQLLRFRLSRPQAIGEPGPNRGRLEVVPLGQIYPRIPLNEVLVVKRSPKEEAPIGMRVVVKIGLVLNRLISQMRSGLREIADDPRQALEDARIARYAKAFRWPVRPSIFDAPGALDLGRLAVESPYAVLLERDPDGALCWDLRRLTDFEHHDGLCSLGLQVTFAQPDGSERLLASRIESIDVGVVHPEDDAWEGAVLLAVCAATTHLALARHFMAVHLVSGDHWDVATRNHLPIDHPLYRLLWPHIFNSFYTNYAVTPPQMLPDGDFVNMFSFTHTGLMAYFDEMYSGYDIAATDPVADWARRGLGDETFECPSQANLIDLFELMHAHASRYLGAYYDSDEAVLADPAVRAWLAELAALVPNGIGPVAADPTRAGLARLIGGYMYEGNTIHDLVGTTLWDYQLWADRTPVRVYRDGRRVPLDVFQRMLNNNFALQIRRAPLLADYSHVALDPAGAALFTQFFEECRALQSRYDGTPTGPWRMEPKNLEINMNG